MTRSIRQLVAGCPLPSGLLFVFLFAVPPGQALAQTCYTPPDSPPESCCGNHFCEPDETRQTCPEDCNWGCNFDSVCEPDHHETSANCSDCPVCNNNGACDEGETRRSCPSDCPQVCGDGYCEDDLERDCRPDCGVCSGGPPCGVPATCGVNGCEDGENTDNCCEDCCVREPGLYCGNETCEPEHYEDEGTCAEDCHGGIVCAGGPPCPGSCNHNDSCDLGETSTSCPSDCVIRLDVQSIDLPLVAQCGQLLSGSLTLLNYGGVNLGAGTHSIVALENDLFAPTVTIQEDVAAGQTYTIPISLVAPALPGNYPVKWHVEGPGGVYGKITHTVGVYGPACEPPEESTGRFSITLDDESPVVVDNASSFSRTQVTRLVKQADRSTRSACVEEPAKGLFSQGDRVLVRDSYLAWFDLTTGDGVQFASRDSTPPGPYSNDWERAGELAGFWALDAQQADFRYKSVQDGCTWPRNQLIPGSASATGANSHGDEFWWDQYAPPTEQCVGIGEGLASDMQRFFCHHYAKAAPMGEWRVTLDGMRDDAGSVHYRTRAFMANGLPPLPREGELGRSIDISDGIDQDKIQALLDSSVEYVGAADGIHVIWKVRPLRADVTLTNVFMDHFATYAQDEDGLSFVEEGKQQTCDPGGSSEQWPTAAFGLPMFHLSSGTMYGNYPATAIPSGVVGVLQLGPACPSGDPYYLNPGLYVDALPGTWLAIGEDPAVLASQRRLVITLPSDASTGDGTEASPRPIPWITMGSYNETRDGALDFGVIRGGPDVTMTMAENNWYVGEYCLSADYSCSPEPPSRPAVRVTHSGECAFGIGCSVTFAATGTAQDGSAVTYAWSGCGSATDAAVVCDKPSSGLVAATVAVTDGHGQVTSAPDSANVYASGFSTGEWSTCTVNGAWICTASGSGGCTRQGTQTRTVTETSWTLEPTAAVASPVSSQSCTETTTGYVTSYIASYDAAWSCTAVGANGCYKNRLSYAASSFVPTSPDAAVPPERLYANGYVATYTTTYAATWTCTASGANGCYKTRLSYSPAAYKVEGPDASVPEDRIYTYGYVATWYAGDWSACTATACNTTGYYNRVVSPATWKPDPPDAPEPQGALACSYECNYTCEDYGLYSTWADCYGAGWSYCGTRYRDDGHGGLLTCRQGYE